MRAGVVVEAFRGRWRLTAAAGACMLVATVGYTLAVRLSGACVDALLNGSDGADGWDGAGRLAVAALACGAVGSLAWSGSDLLMAQVSTSVAVRLRALMVRHTLSLPISFFTDRSVGEVTDRISTDVDTVGSGLVNQVKPIVMGLIGAIAALVISLTVDPRLTALFVPAAAAIIMVGLRTARRVARSSRGLQAEWAEAAGTAEEAFNAREDLRQSLGRGMIMRRWSEHATALLDLGRRLSRERNRLTLATMGQLRLFQLITLAAGAWLAVRGEIGSGAVWAAFGLVTLFSRRIEEVLQSLPRLSEFLAATQRIDELLAEEPEPAITLPVERAPGRRVSWHRPVEIRFEHVDFSYGDGPVVLDDVTFTVRPGSSLALLGRTGSGKTTLARLVNRSVHTPAGTVFLDGVDVGAIDLAELRVRVGVVSQRVEMLQASLRDNIALFDPAIDDDRMIEALGLLGLEGWLRSLPDGLASELGEGRLMLSAGEQQLIAFARLLVRDPAVVLLDEATARLDPATEAVLQRATERLLAGRTSIIIAHRLATVAAVDDVVVLDHGRVVEHGSRGELLADPTSHFAGLVEAAGTSTGTSTGRGTGAGGGTGAGTGRPGVRSGVPPSVRPVRHAVSAGRPADPDAPRRETWDSPTAERAPIGLARVTFRLWRRNLRFGVPGTIGWCVFFTAPAVGAWVWSGLLPRLRPGGAVLVPLLLFGAAAAVSLGGKLLGEYWFGLWWNTSNSTMRSNILAAQLHPHDRLAGRRPDSPGDATSRMWDTMDVVNYTDHYVDLLASGLFVLAMTALSGSWATVPWLVAPVLLPLALASTLYRRMQRNAIAHARLRSEWSGHVADVCAAATTIKGFGGERHAVGFLDGWTRRRQRAALRQRRLELAVVGSIFLTAELGQRVVLAVLALGPAVLGIARPGVAVVGSAVATAEAIGMMPISGLMAVMLVNDAPMVRAKLRRIGRLLPARSDFDLTRAPVDLRLPLRVDVRLPTPRAEHRPLHRLELRDVRVVHADGLVALDGVTLAFTAGELVIVTGAVAAGKSTLLRVLAGLQPVTSGELRWNGEPIAEPSAFLRPPNCAYVAQAPRLVSGTIGENVTLDHEVDVDTALSLAELEYDVARAGGSGTRVGHRGLRLSGGQTQRLATARAAAPNSELLVLDDLSSALDVHTEQRLWQNLREAGTTVVASSYKRVALELADRVVVLDAGRVAAVGGWRELDADFGHLFA